MDGRLRGLACLPSTTGRRAGRWLAAAVLVVASTAAVACSEPPAAAMPATASPPPSAAEPDADPAAPQPQAPPTEAPPTPEPSPAPTATPRPPAPAATAAPEAPTLVSLVRQAADLTVILTVSPARAGTNEVNLYFVDIDGDDRPVEEVRVRFAFLDFPGVATVISLEEAHAGHAFVVGDQMRHAGRWRIEATFRRRGLPDASAAFDIAIR